MIEFRDDIEINGIDYFDNSMKKETILKNMKIINDWVAEVMHVPKCLMNPNESPISEKIFDAKHFRNIRINSPAKMK